MNANENVPVPDISEEKRKLRHKKRVRAYVVKYVSLFIGAIITAVGLEIFLVPNNIIDGGVVGISIMLSAITDYPLG
ncbi:MAG: YitT family protein, partial [Selenomonadaceae bacterium]